MKRLSIILIAALLFAVGCTSQAEKYIQNDFTRVVREDGLKKELDTEVKRITKALKSMSNSANPNAKKSQAMAAKYKKIAKSVNNRINSFNSTGNYYYLWGILGDAEAADNAYAQSQRLKKKAMPFMNHTNKQIKRFTAALNAIDAKALVNTPNLVKVDSINVEYIFKHLIGTPKEFAKPEDAEVESMAKVILTNYFAENPTPTIKSYEYKEDMANWHIVLSDDSHYTLNVVELSDGQLEYQYRLVTKPHSSK